MTIIQSEICKCKTRKSSPDKFLSEFCVQCGRIWVNTLCGDFRSTDRFQSIQRPIDGVWIGHTFIKDKTGQLATAVQNGIIV